jgi:hypothetical protein
MQRCRDALHELRLADNFELCWPVGTVHRRAFKLQNALLIRKNVRQSPTCDGRRHVSDPESCWHASLPNLDGEESPPHHPVDLPFTDDFSEKLRYCK